jgi:hypothetical protein
VILIANDPVRAETLVVQALVIANDPGSCRTLVEPGHDSARQFDGSSPAGTFPIRGTRASDSRSAVRAAVSWS